MVKLARKGHTTVSTDAPTRDVVVRYYNTEIVRFNADRIILCTGGWQTASTKQRMNQASRQFGLGYTVFQKNFVWGVDYKGRTYLFGVTNEITLDRRDMGGAV